MNDQSTLSNERQTRDRERTRKAILDAARHEFARLGLSGARVDEIAKRANANKGMIYYYFGSKEALFVAVLEDVYTALCQLGEDLDPEAMDPFDALDSVVDYVWDFYRKTPEAIAILNSENLYHAEHLKSSAAIKALTPPFEGRLRRLLEVGAQKGVFRSGLDPRKLYVTIAAMAYFYIGNRQTLSFFFDEPLASQDRMDQWNLHMRETARRWVQA